MLNFYCMGVPRSGTSYFGQLVSSHPNAICLHEAFQSINFEREFLNLEAVSAGLRINSDKERERVTTLIKQRKNQIRALGDKMPRAFYHMDRILNQMGGAPLFFLIRNPSEVFSSFDARANNEKDSWQSWMIWLCAYLEQIISIIKFLELKGRGNWTFVSYSYLTGSNTKVKAAERIFDMLRLELKPEVEAFVIRSEKQSESSRSRSRNYTDLQIQLLELPHMQAYKCLDIDIRYTRDVASQLSRFRKVIELLQVDIEKHSDLFRGIRDSIGQGVTTAILNYLWPTISQIPNKTLLTLVTLFLPTK